MSRAQAAMRAVTAIAVLAVLVYLVYELPIVRAETWPPEALGVFRCTFALLLIVRLRRLRPWPLLLWGSPTRLPWGGALAVEHLLVLWQIAAVALLVGAATPIAAAVCLACEVWVFARAYTRSLEDVLFQTVTFFLIFVGAGESWSVDAYAGIAELDRFDHVLARNAWWFAIALVVFSAGFEKLFSPLWQRGMGFNYFVGLPHLVQRPFKFLRRFERLGNVLSWTTVVAELGMMAAAPFLVGRLAVTFVLVGFAICLFVVVDLSFIGQVTMVVLVLFGAGDALQLAGLVPEPSHVAPPAAEWMQLGFIALAVAWVIAVLDVPLGRARTAAQWVTQRTIGAIPNRVFTEVQLYGIYLYRIVAIGADGSETALVRTFELDGSQGPMQRWQPRVFLKFTYEVTDYCLRYTRDGIREAQATVHYRAVTSLMQSAFDVLTSSGRSATRLVLYVRAIDADERAATHADRFALSDWVPLLECEVCGGQLAAARHLTDPPPIKRTMRLDGQRD